VAASTNLSCRRTASLPLTNWHAQGKVDVRTDENAGKEEPRRDWGGRGEGRRHLEGQRSCSLEAGQPDSVGAATRGTAGAAAWRPAAWELLAGSLQRGEAGQRRLEEQASTWRSNFMETGLGATVGRQGGVGGEGNGRRYAAALLNASWGAARLKADPRDVGGESGEGRRGVDCGRRAERWDQLLMWPAESSKNSLVGSQNIVLYDAN
jgi:hypothetical protein